MSLSPTMATTTRTRLIESNNHLRSLIEQLGDRLEAEGRPRDAVEVSTQSVGSFVSHEDSFEKHLDTIGELTDMGVSWTMFPYARDGFAGALDYLRSFGQEVASKVH